MQASSIHLASLEPAHLPGAVALSRQAGWPHRLEDWRMVLDLSEGIVALDDDGHVIGTAMMTPFGENCATINMVIVDESQRGRGLGRQLMAAVIDRGAHRTLRLIATREGLPLYEKLGFRATGEEVVQHQGFVGAVAAPRGVALVDHPALAKIAPLDAVAYGADRTALMRELAQIGRFAVSSGTDGSSGFSVLRPFGRGEVIGPVVAHSPADAKALMAFWMVQRTGAFLRVDTTAGTGLSSWLVSVGLAAVGGGTVMQRGGTAEPSSRPLKTYALVNQALG